MNAEQCGISQDSGCGQRMSFSIMDTIIDKVTEKALPTIGVRLFSFMRLLSEHRPLAVRLNLISAGHMPSGRTRGAGAAGRGHRARAFTAAARRGHRARAPQCAPGRSLRAAFARPHVGGLLGGGRNRARVAPRPSRQQSAWPSRQQSARPSQQQVTAPQVTAASIIAQSDASALIRLTDTTRTP